MVGVYIGRLFSKTSTDGTRRNMREWWQTQYFHIGVASWNLETTPLAIKMPQEHTFTKIKMTPEHFVTEIYQLLSD